MKGKFLGRAVRNFIETMSDELRGYHAEMLDWERSPKDETPCRYPRPNLPRRKSADQSYSGLAAGFVSRGMISLTRRLR